ncbi:MAG: 2OG-Fe(II) oxygenase [Pseudomonadota bacterium]
MNDPEPNAGSDAVPGNAADPRAAEQRGRELVSGAAPDSEAFAEGLALIEASARAGWVDGQLLLGHLLSQYPGLPDAATRARENYRAAAQQGHPEACLRLADVNLFGYGGPVDDGAALAQLDGLAAAGYSAALTQLALLRSHGIGCEADDGAATDLILQAAAQGDTLAFALLTERYLEGQGVPARPDLAWAWLDLACRRGFPAAERRRAQLSGRLTDAQRQAGDAWAQRLMDTIRGLGQAVTAITVPESDPGFPAAFQACVRRQFLTLQEPALSFSSAERGSDGPLPRPRPMLKPLCWNPRVFAADAFLNHEERLHVLGNAAGSLVSTEDARRDSKVVEIDEFEGECAVFGPHLVTPVVRVVQRRWAQVLQISEQHFEPMSVLRYREGHQYAPHVDYFDSARMAVHRGQGDRGGQRLVTALVYLVAPEAGGETVYCHGGPTIAGADGSAVVHYNVTVEGLPDDASLHEGTAITAGEKWLCRTAVRERNLFGAQETVI